MPTFCRHNRLLQNCPICSREQQVEMRPMISPGGHPARAPAPRTGRRSGTAGGPGSGTARASGAGASGRRGTSGAAGLTVRRLSRTADDGFRSPLVPGLRSTDDARRLAEELSFAAGRLSVLEQDPPGLYAEVADAGEALEERIWLAFLIAYIGPVSGEAPFAAIAGARTSWASAEPPALEGATLGPRTAHGPARGARTIDAYRAWAARAGSQAAALTGEEGWTPERRFDRAFERLALPGLHRGARFDLLVTLGRLGALPLRAGSLRLGGNDPVTLAAKRVLGIGDPLLLERRAGELALACELPLEALDLGLFSFGRGDRGPSGMVPGAAPDPGLVAGVLAPLGL